MLANRNFIAYDGNSHRRRVTEGLSEITFNSILRREIDLLEQFGGDGNAASGTDPPQRGVVIHVGVVHVICVRTVCVSIVLVREILFQRVAIPVCTSLSVLLCSHLGGVGVLLEGIVSWKETEGRDKRASLQ